MFSVQNSFCPFRLNRVHVGNNDYIHTIFKANFPHYIRDFINHKPTGRFCSGKLATDITADTMGFTAYLPTYLSPQASGKNLLIGANFAFAGSGYDDKTAFLSAEVENLSLEERRLDEQIRSHNDACGKTIISIFFSATLDYVDASIL